MHMTKRIFKQTPLCHFCLKVVCKKGGDAFQDLAVWFSLVRRTFSVTICRANKGRTEETVSMEQKEMS